MTALELQQQPSEARVAARAEIVRRVAEGGGRWTPLPILQVVRAVPGCHVKTAWRAMGDLVAAGIVVRWHGGYHAAARYRLRKGYRESDVPPLDPSDNVPRETTAALQSVDDEPSDNSDASDATDDPAET